MHGCVDATKQEELEKACRKENLKIRAGMVATGQDVSSMVPSNAK